MPKFKKPIVSAGTYLVGNDEGGRHVETLTPQRLNHWAAQFTRMKQNGLAIPGPWKHAKESIPVVMGNDGTIDSTNNAGFWDDMIVERNEQGIDTLWGIIDAPGDPEDTNTNAGKIGKTVKETSIYARPKFVDGKGNVYNDAIMHAALVTHPIEPGQGNFELIEDGLTIAMSHCTGLLMSADSPPGGNKPASKPQSAPTKKPKANKPKQDEYPGSTDDSQNLALEGDAPTGDLKVLIELLKQTGIALPKDTNAENFNERLSVALQQKSLSDESEEDEELGNLTKPPQDAEDESVPMNMSTPNATPKPVEITADVIMSHPSYKALEAKNQQLFGVMNTQARSHRSTRINALIRSGRVTKEQADAQLLPLLSGFKMSFDADGNEVTSALDTILTIMEAQPAPAKAAPAPGTFVNGAVQQLAPFLMSSVAPDGSDTPGHPQSGFHNAGLLSDTEADALGDEIANNLGL